MNVSQGVNICKLRLPVPRYLRIERAISLEARVKPTDGVVESTALPYSQLPRPRKLQFMRSFLPGGEFHDVSLAKFAMAMRKRYGDIFIMPGMFGRKDWVVVFNTKDIETACRNEGVWPHREGFDSIEYFRTHIRPDVYNESKGLIATQKEEWSRLRSAMNPIFMQPKSLKMYIEPLSNINNEFIERIKEIRDPKTLEVPDNFHEEMCRVIFESVALIAFNRQMGIIRKQRDNPDALTLFRTSREIFRYTFQLDMTPSLWKILPTPTYRKMVRALNESANVAMKIVEESRQLLERRKQAGEDFSQASMMERLLEIDPKIAVIMGLDILFAGVDASSILLSSLLLCLSKNPDKQQKLREEVLRIMPTKDTPLDEQRMKDMPYLRAVIKESQRYYPNGFGTFRQCVNDVTLSGYNIPQGTQILLAYNALCRDSKHFPREDQFLPERWLRDPETGKKEQISPFAFLPFGFGPRMCIGKRVVDLEMETTLAKLIRNFNIEFNYDASQPYKSFFVSEPAIPFRFKFTDVEK
ncbi:probable cytochrome P450 12d1 proximal, mitochondrial [Scaptodrosophila lebanonensis]|uniref:Probable cytochrome P450 12d1 proximal, mitochondrial n=1 Tax=Drosophila lebanonensis TaxID=7225 RepID=A0A6J2UJY6_DROLE|nr:probable cytochrome P450 12d1 proximal, mitochondrial [Scaptodrosophila lebanonensis]